MELYLEGDDSSDDRTIEIPDNISMIGLQDIFGGCVRILIKDKAVLYEDEGCDENEDPVARSSLISFDENGAIEVKEGPNSEGTMHSVFVAPEFKHVVRQ